LNPKTINIARFLLLPLAALPFLSAFLFQLRETSIKQHMRKELKEKTLQTVVVCENDFHWLEPGREILVQNRAFDVSSYKYENGNYIFTGLFDDEETILLSQLQKKQEEENTAGNKALVQLLDLFPASQESVDTELLLLTAILKQYPNFDSRLSSKYESIITPPPKPDITILLIG
jgi:hypothetical protein